MEFARKTGPHTGQLVSELLDTSPYPQERYRSCLGIIRLAKRYGREHAEASAQGALYFGSVGYRAVKWILESRKDGEELPRKAGAGRHRLVQHANVRGGSCYAANGGGGEPSCASPFGGAASPDAAVRPPAAAARRAAVGRRTRTCARRGGDSPSRRRARGRSLA